MRKNILKWMTSFTILVLLTGCAAPFIAKKEAFPKMYDEQPVSIFVAPPINQTTAAEAGEYLTVTLPEPLSYQGFYILPIEVTTELLQQAGVQDGAQLTGVPAEYFAQFGADAVLYTTITKWDTSYYVVGGNVTVGLAYELISTKTGERLWHYNQTLLVDTTDGSSNLLVKIVATAIKTAAQDYLPVARRVNTIAMNTIPNGKYSPLYGKDGETKVVDKNAVNIDN